jgi:phage/conjugal plasmid C-4 type zinc finger TraR family protein
MKNIDHIEIDNQEETEIAQINNLQRNQQAISGIRQQLEKQRLKPSAEFCEECGEDIPQARRTAVPGVQLCIYCQSKLERFKANYRLPDDSLE